MMNQLNNITAMKKLVLLLVALFAVTVILQANKSEKNHTDSNKALTVLCSPDLTELTNKWVEEFNRRNPDMMLMVKTIEESSIEFYPNVPVGFNDKIDVLQSDRHVIEVKEARNWKHALGQVGRYAREIPRATKRIHLFIRPEEKQWSDSKRIEMEEHCRESGVHIRAAEVPGSDRSRRAGRQSARVRCWPRSCGSRWSWLYSLSLRRAVLASLRSFDGGGMSGGKCRGNRLRR